MGCGVKAIGFLVLVLPPKGYINLGKRLGPSVPQLFSSANGDNNSTYLIGGRTKLNN